MRADACSAASSHLRLRAVALGRSAEDARGLSDARAVDLRDDRSRERGRPHRRDARRLHAKPTIVVDRPLTIIGEPGAVIDGSRATHTLRIEADDVTVRGLAFRNVVAESRRRSRRDSGRRSASLPD